MKALARLEWHGEETIAAARRASGRAMYGNAEAVSNHAESTVHRVTGTLARSIHASRNNTGGVIPADSTPDWPGGFALIEVGSWLDYAIYEERRHPYMWPAYEAEREGMLRRYRAAFQTEKF